MVREKTIKHVKVGQVIKIYDEHRLRDCFVEAVYPFFVKAYYFNAAGKMVNITVNYGQLVQAGYESKGGEYVSPVYWKGGV